MNLAIDIIKSGGKKQSEIFDKNKLHSSIVAACLGVRSPEGEAVKIADIICETIVRQLQDKSEVTSRDIRVLVMRHLTNYHPEAAYLYEQYKITI